MKKKELVDAIVAKTEMAKKDVVMVIETMAEVVKATVAKEAVEIPGLVKLEKKTPGCPHGSQSNDRRIYQYSGQNRPQGPCFEKAQGRRDEITIADIYSETKDSAITRGIFCLSQTLKFS